jgi:hypothetical protein
MINYDIYELFISTDLRPDPRDWAYPSDKDAAISPLWDTSGCSESGGKEGGKDGKEGKEGKDAEGSAQSADITSRHDCRFYL